MRVIVFGATGVVGQGVLRECLDDDRVTAVLAVGRSPVRVEHAKLRQIVHHDLFDVSAIADEFAGYDACFFCLGVSSVGMKEDEYRRITYDLTLSVARIIAERSPQLAFVYVSGQGTDAQGRHMWARVKGETENALQELPLRSYAFRPGYIQPTHGVRSKVRLYAAIYRIVALLYPLLRRLVPRSLTTTEAIGRTMIAVAAAGAPQPILETADINEAAT